MKISEEMKKVLLEAQRSNKARELSIDNTVPPHLHSNVMMTHLYIERVLDSKFPRSYTNSWYRNAELNAAVKGSDTSDHKLGQAIDRDSNNNVLNAEIFDFTRRHLPFHQLIWEYGSSKAPRWVHIAFRSHLRTNKLSLFAKGSRLPNFSGEPRVPYLLHSLGKDSSAGTRLRALLAQDEARGRKYTDREIEIAFRCARLEPWRSFLPNDSHPEIVGTIYNLRDGRPFWLRLLESDLPSFAGSPVRLRYMSPHLEPELAELCEKDEHWPMIKATLARTFPNLVVTSVATNYRGARRIDPAHAGSGAIDLILRDPNDDLILTDGSGDKVNLNLWSDASIWRAALSIEDEIVDRCGARLVLEGDHIHIDREGVPGVYIYPSQQAVYENHDVEHLHSPKLLLLRDFITNLYGATTI